MGAVRTATVGMLSGLVGAIATGTWLPSQEGAKPAASLVAAEMASLSRIDALERRLDALDAERDQRELAELSQEIDRVSEARLSREAERLGVTAAIAKSRTGLGPRQQQRVAAAIVREARRHQLDPLLVTAVIQVESSFDAYAVSNVGALGLMQIMPATGKWLTGKRQERLAGERYLFDFERNIELGCAYLADLIRQFGGVDGALLAYNVGPTAARKMLAAGQESPYPGKVKGALARLKQRGGDLEAARRPAARPSAPN